MIKHQRTVVRGALLATGAVAVFALTACAGGTNNASGTSQTAVATGSSAGSTFIPVTTTTTSTLGAKTSTASTGGGRGPSGGIGECEPANLKLSLGPADGAAGHIYQALRFTNVSQVTCVIFAFPGVSYVTGDNGTQVGAPAERDGSAGPKVVLKPGQMASSIITMTDVGVFDPGMCKPTTTRGLRVFLPDSTVSMFIAENGTGCAGNPTSPQLRVQTVKPGAGSA